MIPQIKKILYTTDLTKNSLYAFYFAVDLARKHDASITILHCVETIPASAYEEVRFASLDVGKIFEENKNQEKEEDVIKIKKEVQQFCPEHRVHQHVRRCSDVEDVYRAP